MYFTHAAEIVWAAFWSQSHILVPMISFAISKRVAQRVYMLSAHLKKMEEVIANVLQMYNPQRAAQP